jgi:hypothetical protein
MSTYKFLQDHVVGGEFYPAGSTASTADVGGSLPVNWIPTGNVDPQDASAVTAFWNAGPQLPGLVRPQWSNQIVGLPLVYWQAVGADA